jgi:hypothetical protein
VALGTVHLVFKVNIHSIACNAAAGLNVLTYKWQSDVSPKLKAKLSAISHFDNRTEIMADT